MRANTMEGNRIHMISESNRPDCRVLLLAATLALAASWSEPRASLPAEAGKPANRAAAQAAPTAPDPVQEKFRKLQAEMGTADAAASNAGPGSSANAGEAPEPAPEPPGLFTLSIQVIFGLAFVLLLAVVSIRMLKRAQGRLFARAGAAAGGDLLEVLETCHLGANQKVVALRINDEVGVLGVTQHGMSLLTMLKQPAEEVLARKTGSGNPAAFSESLNKLLEKFKKPKRVSDLLDEA
jgi:flagellar biogenesis protein FliO